MVMYELRTLGKVSRDCEFVIICLLGSWNRKNAELRSYSKVTTLLSGLLHKMSSYYIYAAPVPQG
jgi:hypothetical protein